MSVDSSQYVEFAPSGMLKNSHLQSVLASLPPRRSIVRSRARTLLTNANPVLVDCGAGVRLTGSFSPTSAPQSRGLVVMLHGWEGSADSTYILSAAPRLLAAGFDLFRLNFRDHGDTHHLNEELFHSCRLSEVIGAIQWIQRIYEPAHLFMAGFSLGGNFCLRVTAAAAEAGLDIAKTVAVCPVLDPAQTMAALDRGWVGYEKYFIYKWRNSLRLKEKAFPDLYRFDELEQLNTLTAMTEHFVVRYTEYSDLHTYLQGYAITGDRLLSLDTPTVMLLADDDPVIPIRGLADIQPAPALRVLRSKYGGHCGYINNLAFSSWVDDFIVRELTQV
jgi:predicted alpha/beta-fold hydrolase